MATYRHLVGYFFQDSFGRYQMRRAVLELKWVPISEDHVKLVEEIIDKTIPGFHSTVISLSMLHVERPERKRKEKYSIPKKLLSKS